MNLERHIIYSCSAWPSIHPNRAAALNHLFCVIGNGYEWKNGELVDGTFVLARTKPEDAIRKVQAYHRRQARIYRDAGMPTYFGTDRIPRDIRYRVLFTEGFSSWYPLCQYSKMITFPDDIKLSWLNGIVETANLIIASPPKDAKSSGAKQTIELAKSALQRALELRTRRFSRYKATV